MLIFDIFAASCRAIDAAGDFRWGDIFRFDAAMPFLLRCRFRRYCRCRHYAAADTPLFASFHFAAISHMPFTLIFDISIFIDYFRHYDIF